MNLHSLEPESSASAIPPLPRILFIAAFCQQMYVNTSALKSQSDYTIIFSLNYTMVKRMKKAILIFLCVFAFIFTVWYMQFGGLTENSGALSKTGLIHPVYFSVWGISVFAAIYANLLFAYKSLLHKRRFQYILFSVSAIGMLLTLTCDFNYENKLQYILHCTGSLTFSVLTGVCVFMLFLLDYQKSRMFATFTYIIGLLLITDLILLLIFQENALIEAVPILFALILLPTLNFTNLFKEKAYAAR